MLGPTGRSNLVLPLFISITYLFSTLTKGHQHLVVPNYLP